MNNWELLIIAVGLAMDAFAVSVCKGLSVQKVTVRHSVSVALWFGGFQALMPLIGYYAGVSFSDMVSSVDHWIAFALLGFIGINMIRESFSHEDQNSCPNFSVSSMFSLAVATSIDALAVGVSLAFLRVDIWTAVIIIGLITAMLSVTGLHIGRLFGHRFKSKAEFFGGFILVILGIKILIEHLHA